MSMLVHRTFLVWGFRAGSSYLSQGSLGRAAAVMWPRTCVHAGVHRLPQSRLRLKCDPPDVRSPQCPLNSQRVPPGLLQPLLRLPIAPCTQVITFGESGNVLCLLRFPLEGSPLNAEGPQTHLRQCSCLVSLRKTRASASVSFPTLPKMASSKQKACPWSWAPHGRQCLLYWSYGRPKPHVGLSR